MSYTEKHVAIATAYLKEWVPGFSTGQLAALSEVLAGAELAPAPTPAPELATPKRQGMYVYMASKRGHELDKTAVEIYGTNPVHAKKESEAHAKEIGAKLLFVGIWLDPLSSRGRRFELHMPYDDAPRWAQGWIDAQAEEIRAQKARKRQRAEDEAEDEEAA